MIIFHYLFLFNTPQNFIHISHNPQLIHLVLFWIFVIIILKYKFFLFRFRVHSIIFLLPVHFDLILLIIIHFLFLLPLIIINYLSFNLK